MSQQNILANRATLIVSAIFLLATAGVSADDESSANSLVGRIEFASAEQAAALLQQEDDYTDRWSEFDIQSRLQKNGSKADLLAYSAAQARAWSADEQQTVANIFARVGKIIASNEIEMNLPDEIVMVKTTTADEGGAVAYTRRNYIVISEQAMTGSKESIERLMIHELFHIVSRYDARLRASLYPLIGFEVVNEIDFPDAIKHRRLNNPDAVRTDHKIRLEVDGRPIDAALIMLSNRAYEGGSFFTYLKLGFMELEGNDEMRARLVDGQPVIHDVANVSGFIEQIGKNTQYVISPEEILAENFVDTILETPNMPNPRDHCQYASGAKSQLT